MTAMTASHAAWPVTRVERLMLRTAAALDGIVRGRLERRATRRGRPVPPQVAAIDARTDAQALGSLGILPR